jgi:DMSO/TMAO reductase YedYZ molybdopterin-dependent catalytic subunit
MVLAGAAGLGGMATIAGFEGGRLTDGVRMASDALTIRTQRILLRRRPLVREFGAADISSVFPTNGTTVPAGPEYQSHASVGFRDWALRIDGLVQKPLRLTLPELARLESRKQVTMHCCDEGWSAIAEWKGVPLGSLLTLIGLLPGAQYVVFHCLDKKEEDGRMYYESLDLFDAFHPQTILAYEMNGRPLPVNYGAPLRLRVETQIGYKNAKYIDRLEIVDRLDRLGSGRGGWWEDFDDALWYAGQ